MGLAGDLPVHFTRDCHGWGVVKGTVRALVRLSRPFLPPP